MISKINKQLGKLEIKKSQLLITQTKVQKEIDDVDIKIKEWTTLKKDYEKLEKKFNNYVNPKVEKNE